MLRGTEASCNAVTDAVGSPGALRLAVGAPIAVIVPWSIAEAEAADGGVVSASIFLFQTDFGRRFGLATTATTPRVPTDPRAFIGVRDLTRADCGAGGRAPSLPGLGPPGDAARADPEAELAA